MLAEFDRPIKSSHPSDPARQPGQCDREGIQHRANRRLDPSCTHDGKTGSVGRGLRKQGGNRQSTKHGAASERASSRYGARACCTRVGAVVRQVCRLSGSGRLPLPVTGKLRGWTNDLLSTPSLEPALGAAVGAGVLLLHGPCCGSKPSQLRRCFGSSCCVGARQGDCANHR